MNDERAPSVWAYFDETGHPSDPDVAAFGVCGLRATCAQWLRFTYGWNGVLASEGIQHFHMKNFYSPRHEPYNGWSEEKKHHFPMSLIDLIETVKPVLAAMKKFHPCVAEREKITEEWRESYHGCLRPKIAQRPSRSGGTYGC